MLCQIFLQSPARCRRQPFFFSALRRPDQGCTALGFGVADLSGSAKRVQAANPADALSTSRLEGDPFRMAFASLRPECRVGNGVHMPSLCLCTIALTAGTKGRIVTLLIAPWGSKCAR
jgi:hypothetical protein